MDVPIFLRHVFEDYQKSEGPVGGPRLGETPLGNLEILESTFCYPTSIKIENQMKIIEISLLYLSSALGYTVFSDLKKNDAIETYKKEDIDPESKDLHFAQFVVKF